MPLVAACEKTRPAASTGVVDIPGTCVWAAMLTVLQDEVPECLSCLDATAFHTVRNFHVVVSRRLAYRYFQVWRYKIAGTDVVLSLNSVCLHQCSLFLRHTLQCPRSFLVCTRLCMPCHLRLRLHCLLIQLHKAWRTSGERASFQYILG